jgi:2-hydroxy-6-oxonona-2,4-dienedioate hydrolase
MPTPKKIRIDDIETRYFEAGSGSPIVLIHGGHYGMYYSAYAWSLNFQRLATNHRVIAFDKLGMGFTENPSDDSDYTIDATVEHAHKFLERMRVSGAALVGHSRGAYVAARLALDYPEMVCRLVVTDTNTLAPDDPSTPKTFYERIEKKLPVHPTRESVRYEPVANSYSPAHVTLDFIEEMYRIARLPKTREAKRKMRLLHSVFQTNLQRRRHDILKSIREGHLRQKTMVVWGLNDPSAPFVLGMKLFRLIADKNGETQFHAFSAAGHYTFREHHNEFNWLVLGFVS